MIQFEKNNVIHTRYRTLDIDKLEENDRKFFKIGKIDNSVGIIIEGTITKDLLENIELGLEFITREIINTQPLFRNKIDSHISVDYNNNIIKLHLKLPKELYNTLPLFVNQLKYSTIGSGYIDKNNIKLISKDLYEKYIGPLPEIDLATLYNHENVVATVSNVMKTLGYNRDDIIKLINAINEERGVKEYMDKWYKHLKKADQEKDIDIDDIEYLSKILDVELETFKDRNIDIDI